MAKSSLPIESTFGDPDLPARNRKPQPSGTNSSNDVFKIDRPNCWKRCVP